MPDVTQLLSRIESRELPPRRRIPALLAVALCGCLSCSDHPTYKPIAAFALPEYCDLVAVPVTIHGTDHLFVLDSGCTEHTFHNTLRGDLGVAVAHGDMHTPLDEMSPVDFFVCPMVRLGARDLPRELVESEDMSSTRAALGRDIEGTIGAPWFRANVVQFNFDRREVRILSSDTPPSRTWGQAIDVDFQKHGLPKIKMRFGHCNEQMVIDTGCTTEFVLRGELYDKLLEDNFISPKPDIQVSLTTGVHQVRRGTLSEVDLAGFHNRDLGVSAGGSYGMIGLAYLRRYLVTMDFGRSKIYLKQGARFDKPAHPTEAGIDLLRVNEKTMVSDVTADSDEARAGVSVDDELEAIDREVISGKPIAEIFWMMEKHKLESDSPVLLTVRRNGDVRDIKVGRGHVSEAPSGEQ